MFSQGQKSEEVKQELEDREEREGGARVWMEPLQPQSRLSPAERNPVQSLPHEPEVRWQQAESHATGVRDAKDWRRVLRRRGVFARRASVPCHGRASTTPAHPLRKRTLRRATARSTFGADVPNGQAGPLRTTPFDSNSNQNRSSVVVNNRCITGPRVMAQQQVPERPDRSGASVLRW